MNIKQNATIAPMGKNIRDIKNQYHYIEEREIYMGLFSKKPIYQYDILDRYNINIEKFNANASKSFPQLDYCRLLGETNRYNIFVFRDTNIAIHKKYLLRQDKAAPKKVVYLGEAQKFNCVFQNKIFLMDYTSGHIHYLHPNLICVDIETGKREAYDILSKRNICQLSAGMGAYFSQDCIDSISVQENTLVLGIIRYEEGSYVNLSEAANFEYQIYITLYL